MVLNVVALWKQESRPARGARGPSPRRPSSAIPGHSFTERPGAVRRLVAVGLGTMAFSMEDVLLEPYGGQILHLTVGETTKLTATLAIGGLFGFGLASRVLSRGFDPFRMASYGALVGIPAFLCRDHRRAADVLGAVRGGHGADRLRRADCSATAP